MTEGLETVLGVELRHLLVDEMQDTSTSQYELIELLTEGWEQRGPDGVPGGRSEAVDLPVPAGAGGAFSDDDASRGGWAICSWGRCILTANFRSQAGLVAGFNADFSRGVSDGE